MKLRDYQQKAIDETLDWLAHNQGNPCLELPTGSGKSLIVAEMCRKLVQDWGQSVLMVTASKELISQNAEKMLAIWPNAPMGIYSAGLGKRQLGNPITFAGIQSVYRRAVELGPRAMMIVDECHLIGHEDAGMYRQLINELTELNPHMRVLGLTATPFRLGHGLITDEPAIFKDIIQPTSIEELIYKGYLSPLRSKLTGLTYDTSGVHKRGGEFIEGELAAAVDTDEQNDEVVRETIAIAGDRKAWLFFCTGVLHSVRVRDALRAHGITAECVVGETPKAERDDILRRFKSGEVQALTNANVLTTGFDYPAIDLIAMLRPTMSPVIYIQQGGRGLRIADGKKDCLVLDFAGVVAEHGPITAVAVPTKKGSGKGEAPTKVCDKCHEIVAASTRVCPTCGSEFPAPEKAPLELRDDDIMKNGTQTMEIASWYWASHTSKSSGKEMLRVDYFGKDLTDPKISEYLCLRHEGYAKKKGDRELAGICKHIGMELSPDDELDALAGLLNSGRPPATMAYKKDGKFWRVLDKGWEHVAESPEEIFGDDDIPF